MRIRDERGSILLWTALFLGLFLAAAALVFDFGFQRIQRARLQTAVDAATLAAITESDAYADITAYGEYQDEHCDSQGNCWTDWHSWSSSALPRVLARDADRVARAAMAEAMAHTPHISYTYQGFTVSQKWAELRPGSHPEEAAQAAYAANASQVKGAGEVQLSRAGLDSMAADAQARHTPFLLRLFGVQQLGEHVSGATKAEPR